MVNNLRELRHHRNGSLGNSFYSITFNIDDLDSRFLATFETTEDDKHVFLPSCRVIKLDNVTENWRGDIIGGQLQRAFNGYDGVIYDLIGTI